MLVAHILKNAGHPHDGTAAQTSRVKRMVMVLDELGYKVAYYGRELCNKERAFNLETQVGVVNGYQVDYADKLHKSLSEAVNAGDIIIVTEAWQSVCFRGMLDVHKGRCHGAPVIELWVDYPDSFANYRVFSTRFAMSATAARDDRQVAWQSNWITARPLYDANTPDEANDFNRNYGDDPFSLAHMEGSVRGIAVCAPDWGAWAETIKHGVSGLLYRSLQGCANAKQKLLEMDGKRVTDWVASEFSLDRASTELAAYLKRVTNG